MLASLLQLAGLLGVVVGLGLLAGAAGFFLGGGAACLYVGLAADRRRV